MEKLIYVLCLLTTALCAGLLMRSYFSTRHRLLLWSGLCFIGLTANNLMLVLDRMVYPLQDLSTWRLGIALVAVMLLVVGLIMESDK